MTTTTLPAGWRSWSDAQLFVTRDRLEAADPAYDQVCDELDRRAAEYGPRR